MKKLYKIMLASLFIFSCFVPLSVSAEESSSFVISTNPSSYLSSEQLAIFDEYIRTQLVNDDLYIYFYTGNNNLGIVDSITSFDGDYVTFGFRYLVDPDGNISSSSSTVVNRLSEESVIVFFFKYDSEILYGESLIPDITVSTSVSGLGGSVSGSGVYAPRSGEYITVEAFPDFGYEFDYWSITNQFGTSTTDINPYYFTNSYDISFVAHFKYTGISPTPPPPTPTPDPEGPSYEMNTDFKYLLSNPAIASLVQYAVNELNSNTWWIDREIYNYTSASCPSGSTPLYSTYGYVERFVLYNFNGSSVVAESDSINHQGQSSIGCLIDGTSSQVVIPSLNSTPTITETLFFGFDLFEIPQADFYELLSDIRDLLATPDNSINNTITSGNSISQNATSSIVDTNSALADSSQTYEQFESQFNSNLTSSLDNIDFNSVNLVNSNDFVKTASWVKIQFDDILDSSGIYKTAISFVLIIGLALLLLGRRL